MVAGATVRLTANDGTVHDLPTGGGTLTEVVTAINAATADTGVTATAVSVDRRQLPAARRVDHRPAPTPTSP